MTDDHLLTAAKLREQVDQDGDLDSHPHLEEHVGLVDDPGDLSSVSFLQSVYWDEFGESFSRSDLGTVLLSDFAASRAARSLDDGDALSLSHLVGVTERDLSASSLRIPVLLLQQMDNNGAPAFLAGAGNPNSGKTNSTLLLSELARARHEDLLVISNFESSHTDIRVTSSFDLATVLLDHRDVPKFVVIDEGSTHFDARVYRREVATQFTPLAKRFAKIGVYAVAVIGHTGMDLHPEVKRLSTLPFYKYGKERIRFFQRWPDDADMPVDELFAGDLADLEETTVDYDPNAAAPWNWNLPVELFARDLDWPDLLDALRDHGPENG